MKVAAALLVLLIVGCEVAPSDAGIGDCPSDFIPARDLDQDRAACTAECNRQGYCCTNNYGGCQRATCSAGCLFAWHVELEVDCKAECTQADNQCYYTHAASAVELANCGGAERCGCPGAGEAGHDPNNVWGASNDCGATACERGCELAANIFGHSFYGRELTSAEVANRSATSSAEAILLDTVLDNLLGHMQGLNAPLADSALVSNSAIVTSLAPTVFRQSTSLILKAFDLVDAYEAGSHGPLFEATKSDFDRTGSGDGRDVDRAMLAVQQAIMDEVYNGGLVANCSRHVFQGRGWQTASYYPGAASPPADPTVVHLVVINASVPAVWGVPVAFAEDHSRKPTGLYLTPGGIGVVTVPPEMVNADYKILVGAQTNDNSNKGQHRRMDRVTVTYDISGNETVVIANPLGGGVYILVPYLADLGVVSSVRVTGDVIQSPLFQLTSFNRMTDADWAARRTAPGPWADFETDKFMLNVPSSWVYAFEDAVSLMRRYDTAMDGAAEMFGYPVWLRNRKVLYLQNDLHIKHGAYGIGYPQVNTLYNARSTYDGNVNHWLLRDPMGWPVCQHELGHAQLNRFYRGETEAIVNFVWTYMAHVKFNVSFDAAFNGGMDHSNYMPDDAAVHWMITPNFRAGNEMDRSNTPYDEFRYQHRGYAKYADIVRLFGWDTFTWFYHKESLAHVAGLNDDGQGRHDWSTQITLDSTDSRTLRWSIQAGVDLTPLIHFWGIFPTDPAALAAEMQEHGLGPSLQVRCLLERYKSLIPADNAQFNTFFEKIHPGRPTAPTADVRYGIGWYNVWRDTYNSSHGQAAQNQAGAVLTLYYGGSSVLSSSCAGVVTGAAGQEVVRPSCYTWQNAYGADCAAAPTGGGTCAPGRSVISAKALHMAGLLIQMDGLCHTAR